MLRPDSVRRVRPPKTTMPKTLVAEARSQIATLREEVSGKDDDEGEEPEALDLASFMLRERAPKGVVDGGAVCAEDDWDRD